MGNFQGTESKFPLKVRSVKRFGCLPDIPDQRDNIRTFPDTIEYYQTVDLRKSGHLPTVKEQGKLGSSSAFSVLSAYIYSLRKDKLVEEIQLSPLFIYYNQRYIAGTIGCDSGASIRDALKVIERLGVCKEDMYPYTTDYYNDRPTNDAYKYAYDNKYPIQYCKLKLSLENIMKGLSLNFPIIFGFTVYESFIHKDTERTGVMPEPKNGEKIVGYHSVLVVGYDIHRKHLLCMNSWGSSWGQEGFFWMPFSFVNERNCGDPWIVSNSYGIRNRQPVKKPMVNKNRDTVVLKEEVDNLEFRDIDDSESEESIGDSVSVG